ESTDTTREIAECLDARVIINPWPGFAKQKQFGVDAASYDWIFSLDADERVSPELRDEISALRELSAGQLPAGYRIPRLSYYMGRPIRHSGWYPDWQLRLFDRRRARWSEALIHESVKITDRSKPGVLAGDIIHYTIDSAEHHNAMIGERYAPLAAHQMFENGTRTSPFRVAAAGPIAFLSTYILKAGFLDGWPGFCIARFAAHHAFMKYLCLWQMQTAKSNAA
ncbi:MAG: glycosyltransferase family 2 protein, partial [Pyrinomonadaceae bacterium]